MATNTNDFAREHLEKDRTVLRTGKPDNHTLTFKSLALTWAPSAGEAQTDASQGAVSPSRNRLLSSLAAEELAKLQPHLVRVRHEQREILIREHRPIDYVYFPETMVLSLVSKLDKGATVEVGTAGFEGMVGLQLFLGDRTSTMRTFVQLPGTAMRMATEAFVQFSRAPGQLHEVMLRYTTAFLTQVSQTAACNCMHMVHERCARWLLLTHDRVGGDRFPLTHQFLAFMLGVRRAGVTICMGQLQAAGIVSCTRGWVQVIDRAQLEKASCACYRVVRGHNERVLQGVSP